MKFREAGLFGSAAIVGVVLALAPVTGLAYNSNNHGHHYGQLKHQQAPPPNPPPVGTPQTATGPSAAVHHLTTAVAGQSTASVVARPVLLPVPVIITAPRTAGDGMSWLVLLILPLLVAAWLMVFARGAITMSRRMRRSPAPA